jgi:hypothetical protein
VNLRKAVDTFIQSVLAQAGDDSLRAQRAAVLLASPIPTAVQRRQLRLAYGQFGAEPANLRHGMTTSPGGDDAPRSATIRHVIDLERQLWKLFPTDLADEPAWELPDSSSDEFWTRLTEIGGQVRERYRMLPEAIAASSETSGFDLQMLVDGRDARRLRPNLQVKLPPLDIADPPAQPTLQVRISPEQIDLKRGQLDQPQVVKVVVSCDRPLTDPVSLEPDVSPLAVSLEPSSSAVLKLDRNLQAEQTFSLQLRPQAGPRTTITFLARSGTATAGRAELPILRPPRYEMSVSRQPGPADFTSVSANHSLMVYPNRTTAFRFQIRSDAEETRTVKARLFGGGPRAEDRMLLAEVPELRIPPNQDVPMTFPTPAAETEDAGADGTGEADTADSEPAVADRNVPAELEIVVADQDGEAWTYPLRLRVISPSEYVQARFRTLSDAEQSVVTAEVSLRPDAPEGLLQQPVPVRWDLSCLDIPSTESKPLDRLDAEKGLGEIFVKLAQRQGLARVCLDVDDYPRALMYQLDLQDPQPAPPLYRSAKAIKITSLRMADAPRAYVSELPATEPQESPALEPLNGQSAAFPVPKPGHNLALSLRADAPWDALGGRESDYIEVYLEKPFVGRIGEPIELRQDRDVRFLLAEPPGESVRIQTLVSDYDTLSLPLGQESGRFWLSARLVLDGQVERQDRREIVFDSSDPVLRDHPLPEQVIENSPLSIDWTGYDLAGVSAAEAGFLKLIDPQPPEYQKLSVTKSDTGDFYRITGQLDTQGLQSGAGYRVRIRLEDRLGNAAEETVGRVVILPKPKPKPPAPLGPGTVRGFVFAGRTTFNPPRIEVKLTQGTQVLARVRTSADGRFEFPNVKPGSYELQGSGFVITRNREGTLGITLQEKADFDKEYPLELK